MYAPTFRDIDSMPGRIESKLSSLQPTPLEVLVAGIAAHLEENTNFVLNADDMRRFLGDCGSLPKSEPFGGLMNSCFGYLEDETQQSSLKRSSI